MVTMSTSIFRQVRKTVSVSFSYFFVLLQFQMNKIISLQHFLHLEIEIGDRFIVVLQLNDFLTFSIDEFFNEMSLSETKVAYKHACIVYVFQITLWMILIYDLFNSS